MLDDLQPASKITPPKEWRAAIEFDGTNGLATTPPTTGQQPNFDEFLVEQGFDPAKIEISAATTIGPNGVVPPNLVGIVSQPQWNAASKEDVAVLLGQPQVTPSSTVDTLPEVNNPMGN